MRTLSSRHHDAGGASAARLAAAVLAATLVATAVFISAKAAGAADDPCAEAPRAAFTDVPDTSVHASGIDCLVRYGITHGVSFDRFEPGSTLQRDEFATLVDRTLTVLGVELNDPAKRRFADVAGTHAGSIERLAEAGIVVGRSSDTFAPASPVHRDQMATVLVRAHHLATSTELQPVAHEFTDLDGNHHEPMIAEAAALGLLRGVTPTTYGPRLPTSRAQAATVMAQMLRGAGMATGLSGADTGRAHIDPVPVDLRRLMETTTWQPGCPVAPSDLRLLHVVHDDFAGTDRWGLLVVHHDVADDVVEAFRELHVRGFRIARMQPVERFAGDDDASMAANNTSAFNCRRVTGGGTWSEHSYGRAIDINPVQNPYVRDGVVLPTSGGDYLDRDRVRFGMLTRPGAVEVFDDVGWGWGGDWESLKDYQHVSLTGR